MSPPSIFSLFGLPRSLREELNPLLSAWVPRREELKGVEVVEVKAGAGKLSKPQEYMLGRLREEAGRAREILGRPVEVSYRVVRVELEGSSCRGVHASPRSQWSCEARKTMHAR
jgi:hypothetical protein